MYENYIKDNNNNISNNIKKKFENKIKEYNNENNYCILVDMNYLNNDLFIDMIYGVYDENINEDNKIENKFIIYFDNMIKIKNND